MEMFEDIYANEDDSRENNEEEENIYEMTTDMSADLRNEAAAFPWSRPPLDIPGNKQTAQQDIPGNKQTTPIDIPGNKQTTPLDIPGSDSSWKTPFQVSAVCLGLLFVLFLAGITGLSVQNTALTTRVTTLESYKSEQIPHKSTEKVVFAASLGNCGYLGPYDNDTTLKFQDVLVNEYAAYNSNTGIFTAPVRGVYFFMYSGHSNSTRDMGLSLIKNRNNSIIATLQHAAGNRMETTSSSIYLTLDVGDQISVKLSTNTWVFDNIFRFTTFMGQLVFPL
ncbi:hypothetical protein DPEC_G00296760 [Dallia pectoralis]|uniref:Uncharacterized protein n=1 Tax=Dallia pectoralis TaxID=75939 RepID=A0ACC2FFD4_DALPE|nr:hypothetical protein DPEC_G00296760 [Dallia pectoralis]